MLCAPTAPAPPAARSARSRPTRSASSRQRSWRPARRGRWRWSRSATTPTRSPGTTATTPASTRSKTCASCASRSKSQTDPPRRDIMHPHGAGSQQKLSLPGIRQVIAVASGKGGAQLTLTQTAPLTGAVIVTTPQDVALIDARKGLEMFRQVRVPVLGIIENMSYFEPAPGQKHYLFGRGGGQRMAADAGVPFLGEVPIDPRVTECGDQGEPIVQRYPDSAVAQAYLKLAGVVVAEAGKAAQQD